MGVLRPYYLGQKKEVELKDADGGSLVIRNGPDLGLRIEASIDSVKMAESPGKGMTLRLQGGAIPPQPLNVSRAVHKIAYLALLATKPELALLDGVDELRRFVATPTDASYRPYTETFAPGAPPGFSIRFFVRGQLAPPETHVVDFVAANLRLHHCIYDLSLIGRHVHLNPAGQLFPVPTGPSTLQPIVIEFGVDRVEERPAEGS